ncbi:MAG TPA: efflux RND transporter permease subunit [Candidatus Paceibacterota bacterium]|nr:efflux RND transporter permease subunit [Candidatus Paceibacterota bacterium]
MDHKNNEHSSDSRYLERLTFNPELRKTWLNFFVTNFRVVMLLILVITAWGIYSFASLPRESNPEVKIPIGIVSTVYPGASPSDVEEFVTKKIESKLSGLKGVKKITSNSYNSLSSVQVEFNASENLADAIRNLRDKVADAKPDLSTEAKDPIVTEISLDDTPMWAISLTGPYDGFTLRAFAEDVKDQLERIPGVREVHISGGDETEYEIAYRPDDLIFYGISADDANRAILSANVAIPAGNFESGAFIFPIRADGRMTEADEIGNIPVTHMADGGTVYVRDVANVSEKAVKKTSYSRLSIGGSDPKNAVSLSVVKRQGASVLETAAAARAVVNAAIAKSSPGITYNVSLDMAKEIEKSFDQLSHDFLITVLLVSVILFLIVGLKEAFVAGLAIPLVFFVSFGFLHVFGMTLNFLSLFSLILSLGLLVDDAIVVVSATKQYINTGKFTPEEAVLLVLNDFKWVLTTTTLATVWAFLPLLMASGIVGEYLKSIPITVSITLVSSLLIALMVNHPLAAVLERIRMTKKLFYVAEAGLVVFAGMMFYNAGMIPIVLGIIALAIEGWLIYWYEKGGREKMVENERLVEREWKDDALVRRKLAEQGAKNHDTLTSRFIHGIVNFHRFLPIYERSLKHYIFDKKRRRWVLGGVTALFIASLMLVATGIVRNEFFPQSDQDYVYIDARAAVGSTLDQTDRLIAPIEKRVQGYAEVGSYSSVVGQSSIAGGGFGGGTGASNLASITLTLKDKKDRAHTSYELADIIRKDLTDADIPGVTISVSAQTGGPPAGAAFQANIAGDDLTVLTKIINDLKPIVASIPGAVNVDSSLKDSVPEYTFKLDQTALERNYLTAASVGTTLRTAVSGVELMKVIKGEKEISLQATFDRASIPDLASIQNLEILNAQKQPVFLKDVATIELRPAVDTITRIDQKRTVVLTAAADSTTNGPALLAAFQKKTADYRLPAGYTITFGGENEQNAESFASILRAMLIAMVLIVSTLVIQFNSFRKAIIVLVPIPLALIGVFWGMAVFDVSLGLPGLIGILALFGIVVKNSIILVDKINLNLKSGIAFVDAVADAGKSRLEAIFITSICTIFGILPVTLSDEFWRALGSSVIFGLMLSSFLTLYIVPAVYLIVMRSKEGE